MGSRTLRLATESAVVGQGASVARGARRRVGNLALRRHEYFLSVIPVRFRIRAFEDRDRSCCRKRRGKLPQIKFATLFNYDVRVNSLTQLLRSPRSFRQCFHRQDSQDRQCRHSQKIDQGGQSSPARTRRRIRSRPLPGEMSQLKAERP